MEGGVLNINVCFTLVKGMQAPRAQKHFWENIN